MRSILLTLPAWIIVTLLRLNTPIFAGDDAYMTFRVAKNFQDGFGLIYNLGDYYYVSTTVLWSMILGLFSIVFNSEPKNIFTPLNYLLDLANCYLVFQIIATQFQSPFRAMFTSMLFALSWHNNISSFIGMESSFFTFLICLCGLSLINIESKPLNQITGSIASALTFMTRPEGIFVAGSFALVAWIKLKKFPLKIVAYLSVLCSLFLIATFLYFGTVIPNAAVAKNLAYHRSSFQAVIGVLDHLVLTIISSRSIGLIRVLLIAILSFLWFYGIWSEKNKPIVMMLGVLNSLTILFYTIGNPFIFEWYLTPLTISYCISIPAGFLALANKFTFANTPQIKSLINTTLATTIIILGIFRYSVSPFSFHFKSGPGGFQNSPLRIGETNEINPFLITTLGPKEREEIYIEVANKYKSELTRDKIVMAPEFGAFGYYTNSKIISSIGHNDPEMLQFLPVPKNEVAGGSTNAISFAMVDHFKPDYVLSLEVFIRNSLLKSEQFLDEYEILEKRKSNIFGSNGIYFFKKKLDQ